MVKPIVPKTVKPPKYSSTKGYKSYMAVYYGNNMAVEAMEPRQWINTNIRLTELEMARDCRVLELKANETNHLTDIT